MLTKGQKILIHQAKRQAGLDDTDYRDLLETLGGPGCRSSTDPRLDNRHLDKLLAFMEAIYWRKVPSDSQLSTQTTLNSPFRARGYWARKNTAAETSRDRFSQAETVEAIIALETELTAMGNHLNYLAAIRSKVAGDRTDPKSLWQYRAALERTLAAKKKKLAA